MPTQALTTEFLNSLPGRSSAVGLINYFDTETKGFMLEVRASGGATFYFRYRDGGGRIRMNRIGRRDEIALADARAKAHQMKKMVTDGGDPKAENHRFKDVPTFGEFFYERFLPFVKARKRSWQTDEVLARNHLLPAFEPFRLNRIMRGDVLAFQDAAHAKGYAPGTCNRMLVLLKFMYNCAIRWEILPSTGNPCVGVDPLDDNGARERYLSAPEVQRLFEELDNNRNVQVAQVVRLLLYTGARKREVLDARWEHVDFDRRLLTVPLSKSGKPRYIPLSDAAVELLQGLPRVDDIPWVFFNPKTRKPPVSIFYAWDSIRAKVGLKEVRLHDLRHSFASFLVNSGRSLYEVQRLLGHHDPKMTMRYAHLSPGALIDAANVVGQMVTRTKLSAQNQTLPCQAAS
jgi:integrase